MSHAKFMGSHLDGEGARWMEGYRNVDGATTGSGTPIASGTPPATSTGTQPRRTWRRPPYGAWGNPYWPYPAYDTPIIVGVTDEVSTPSTTIINDKKNNTLQYAVIALAVIGAIVIVKKLTS